MAVTKEEASKALSKVYESEILTLEVKIDAYLKANYSGSGKVVVYIDKYPSQKVKEEIIKRYQNVGWCIEFKSDQRDGDWVVLS